MVALAAQAVAGIKGTAQAVSPLLTPRRWRLVDRLGEQIIRDLLRDGRSGATKRVLAERYGISLSSVKRLVRKNSLH
jgi:DNA invertase Pin-like site-specific DNA recombinase